MLLLRLACKLGSTRSDLNAIACLISLCRAVERLLVFVQKLVSFQNDKYQSDSELAVDLLKLLIPLTRAKDKAVRFRSCQMTAKLLTRFELSSLASVFPPAPASEPSCFNNRKQI